MSDITASVSSRAMANFKLAGAVKKPMIEAF
jgi:hypothetical protein